MTGNINNGPKRPVGDLIGELKKKQETKRGAAPSVVAQPEVRKVPVVPPLQGELHVKQPGKRPFPVMPKKQAPPVPVVPKRAPAAVPVPKQHRPLPVPQRPDLLNDTGNNIGHVSLEENIRIGLESYYDGDIEMAARHYKLALDQGASYAHLPRNTGIDHRYFSLVDLYARIGVLFGTGQVGKRDLNMCHHFGTLAMRRTVLELNWEYLPMNLRTKLITDPRYPDILKLLWCDRSEFDQERMMSGYDLLLLLCRELDIDIDAAKKTDVDLWHALKYLKKVYEERDADVNYQKGVSFLRKNNMEKAAYHFKLAIDQAHPEAEKQVRYYRELQARIDSLSYTGEVGERRAGKYGDAKKGTILERLESKIPSKIRDKLLSSRDYYEILTSLEDKCADMNDEQTLEYLSGLFALNLEEEKRRDKQEFEVRGKLEDLLFADSEPHRDQIESLKASLYSMKNEEGHSLIIDSFISGVCAKDQRFLSHASIHDLRQIALSYKWKSDNARYMPYRIVKLEEGSTSRNYEKHRAMLLAVGALYARENGKRSLETAFIYFNDVLAMGPLRMVWLMLPYDLKVRVMKTFEPTDEYLEIAVVSEAKQQSTCDMLVYILRQAGVDRDDPQYHWLKQFYGAFWM